MTDRRTGRPPRKRPPEPDDPDVPRASRADIVALIAQWAVPSVRPADFMDVAPALVREARRYDIIVPAWLAAIAGYPGRRLL